MSKKDLLIGCHVGMNKQNNYFLGSVKEALSYQANTFMFYTGAPQSSLRIPLNQLKINEGKELLKCNNIDIKNVVVHAPYIMNIATNDVVKREYSKKILSNEAKRTIAFGCKYLIFHPGNYLDGSLNNGIRNIAMIVNEVIKDVPSITLCLETMPGKGTQIGKTFDELKQIIDLVDKKDNIAICLDTCHINDGGYDVRDVDKIIDEFDKIIGLNYLRIIHINDSVGSIGSKKDNHANIGYGTIGFQTLYEWVHNSKLIDVIKILETPWYGGKPYYKDEISILRSGKWKNFLKRDKNE